MNINPSIKETTPYFKRMITIAIPIMIQNGITNFVSMLDNIMVGRVGTLQMTGVSIVNQLIFIYGLCIFGAMSGAGIFTAQFFGKKDKDGVRSTLQYKLVTALLLATAGTVIFSVFGEALIGAYLQGEASPEDVAAVMSYSKSYLKITLVGSFPFAFSQAYASTMRETTDRIVPMTATISAVFVNLIFNYLLIFGKFGFPELGIEGAAIATTLSRFVELSILVIWAHTHKDKYSFIPHLFTRFTITLPQIKKITLLTIPLLLNETLWAAGIAVLNQCYSVRGLDVVAAINIVSTLTNVFNVAFIAFGSAIGIILSQMLGAGEKKQAKFAAPKLLIFSMVSVIAIALIMSCIAPFFPKIYNTEVNVQALATTLILTAAIFMPVQSGTNAGYFTLRSGGKTLMTFLFDCGFVWIINVPLAFILSRYTDLYIVWLYASVLSTEIFKCALSYILVKKGIWLNTVVD
ncbi:MAG: MATE family efflux transporter [Clostridia bacterium]|nr:MATE family efflux transporter [Clostridia bacterium]